MIRRVAPLVAVLALVVPLSLIRPALTTTAVSCADTSGIETKVPCAPLALGAIHKPLPEFSHMIDTTGTAFTGVADPVLGVVVQNTNIAGQADKHSTMGTARDLVNGSTSCRAFAWEWRSAAEFTPSGWSLVWQLQMSGSPIAALSNDSSTRRWFLTSRDGTVARKYDLFPLTYGQWEYFAVCVHLANKPGGWVTLWASHTGWPDVSLPPLISRTGIDTWQEAVGKDTLGMYAAHGKVDVYRGYFLPFGRALTAQRAVDIAR